MLLTAFCFLNEGNFGRKENGWRSHGRNGPENVNQGSAFNGSGSRARAGAFSGGKIRESSSLENDVPRKEGRDRRKQFEAEDFVSDHWVYSCSWTRPQGTLGGGGSGGS